jgi:hypothetical protein
MAGASKVARMAPWKDGRNREKERTIAARHSIVANVPFWEIGVISGIDEMHLMLTGSNLVDIYRSSARKPGRSGPG